MFNFTFFFLAFLGNKGNNNFWADLNGVKKGHCKTALYIMALNYQDKEPKCEYPDGRTDKHVFRSINVCSV